jgi:hypothetical protein
MNTIQVPHQGIKKFAQIGLIAIGIVYCLLGAIAFMAAFHLGNHASATADKQGVITWLKEMNGGSILLAILIAGLLCYAIWRFIQAFTNSEHEDNDAKGWGHRLRYLFSGLVYLSFTVSAFKLLLDKSSNSGNSKQQLVSTLLDKPLGQWLVGLLALIIAGAGIYQIWYALSEKYKKHADQLRGGSTKSNLLLNAGKAGYIARGIVWITIAWLLIKAALEARASKAGDTAEAFQFLENGPYGSIISGAIGAGLICYGIFCFIRSKYETL